MHKFWSLILAANLATALPSAMAVASDTEISDRASFQVQASTDVDNDRVLAVLSVTAEDKDPADLADGINRSMSWALEQAKGARAVQISTGSYQTYPVHDEKKIVNWRGRQELYLESSDVEQVTRLIGLLQNRLQMQSLQFSVSPERADAVEEDLIEQALTAFQKRAVLITKSLGAGDYRLLDVTITSGGREPIRPMRAEMAMAGRAGVSEPALESGTSRITIQASGAIQLLRD